MNTLDMWEPKVVTIYPKLTQDIFSHPKCPKWAKYAAVTKYRAAYVYEDSYHLRTTINGWIGRGRNEYICMCDAENWKHSLIERNKKYDGEIVYVEKEDIMSIFCDILKSMYEDPTKGIIPCVTVFDAKEGVIEFLSHGKFKVEEVKKEHLKTPLCPDCGSETSRIYNINWDWDYMECSKCKHTEKLNEITLEEFDRLWQVRKENN